MPDDERTRRRLGDETKGRIADLASGWSVEPDARPAAPAAARADDTEERIAELASGWSVDPEVSAVPLAPPLGRSTRSAPVHAAPSATPSAPIATRSGPTAVPLPPLAVPAPLPRSATPTSQPLARNRPITVTPPGRNPGSTVPPPRGAATPMSSPPVRSASPTAPPIADAPSPRKKAKTLPPPPPGSEARKQLETAIVEAKDTPRPAPVTTPPPPPRSARTTAPPPIPAARSKPTTMPPPSIATNAVSGSIGGDTGMHVIADPASAPAVAPYESSGRTPAVPVGEFDDSSTLLEKDKLKIAHAQSTIKRDAASALLGIAEPALTQVKAVPVEVLLTESAEHLRGDPTSVDPSTSKFERGDPTELGRTHSDASNATSRVHTRAGRLRTVAALRRQRGIFGDVRYVATATFGVRHARRELDELEAKQQARQQERRKHMVILGRTAVTSDGLHHPALSNARESLGGVEDERARHRGQVVAADQELARVTRDRQSHAMQFSTDLSAIDAELAELAKRLEPLLKEQVVVTRRGAELRESLRRIDAKIQETTASLVSVRGPKVDPGSIQAELATLKADRVAVQRDEPKLAGELDALNPRIAAIEAKRSESQKRRTEIVQAEDDDKRRTEELLTAIGAKRKVMDRAAGDAEVLRDKILFELGERLYVDRPADLAAQLAPVDAIDVELGTNDRRVMELREILSSIDKAKLWRGIAVITLTVLVVGGIAGWLIYMLS